jgi:putative nucleotidyltransferase with HDIG domain
MVGTAAALANALEARDDYTAGHAREIAELAAAVGTRLGMSDDELDELRFGAIFHDIGKIAVPDEVLRKPEPLTEDERGLMERHTIVGAEILEPIPGLGDVRDLVRHSHERWDGTGYPDGLKGDLIPLGSRVISVVDAWHAMVTDRPYREAMGEPDAKGELRANAGLQFDPVVVEAFLAMLAERGQV